MKKRGKLHVFLVVALFLNLGLMFFLRTTELVVVTDGWISLVQYIFTVLFVLGIYSMVRKKARN